MKKLLIGVLLVILILIVSACSSARVTNPTIRPATTSTVSAEIQHQYGLDRGPFSAGGAGSAPAPMVPPSTTSPPSMSSQGNTSSPTSIPSERMVVRTGNIQMVVNEIAAAMENITRIAAKYGGYVVTSQRGQSGERNVGSISIRILAESYENALKDLRATAKSVTSESTSAQDVTEEYTDLNSKVKNLEATEAQLLKIMQGATKTEDVLSIQRELTNVRGNIEQAKGRMQYLERTSSTSLIQIQLEEAVLALKFNADKVNVGTNETIHFSAEVIGGFAPYNYQWDFGDGNTSNEISPSHSYKDPGVYFVALKVTDDKGYTNTLARSPYISVVGSWKPTSVASSAWNGFTAFGRVFVNILIWLGIFSPVWIIIGGIIWFSIWRKNRKRTLK